MSSRNKPRVTKLWASKHSWMLTSRKRGARKSSTLIGSSPFQKITAKWYLHFSKEALVFPIFLQVQLKVIFLNRYSWYHDNFLYMLMDGWISLRLRCSVFSGLNPWCMFSACLAGQQPVLEFFLCQTSFLLARAYRFKLWIRVVQCFIIRCFLPCNGLMRAWRFSLHGFSRCYWLLRYSQSLNHSLCSCRNKYLHYTEPIC